jgi:hypothetical protein
VGRRLSLLSMVALGVALLCGITALARGPEIQLGNQATPTVDIVGLDPGDLSAIGKQSLHGDAWTGLFAVYVVPEAGKQRGPALLGSYRIDDGMLRFQPRFPLVRGVRYQAVFVPLRLTLAGKHNQNAIEKELLIARPKTEPARVTHVYPSADRLPENQLKFYIHFSAPMARGGVYRHIKLLNDKGKEVDVPFLELDEELWDDSHQRLTLFCDPGRIKRGLKPREEDGPILEEGKKYTLVIDTGLEDANGNALKEPFRKAFQALPPDDKQPDPRNWKVQSPTSDTRDALIVTLPKSLDHALLERVVWVTDSRGRKVPGTVSIEREETIWRFIPTAVWSEGKFQLVADTRLEDLAGNSIARPFEVDVFHPIQREVKTETVQVPFEVRRSARR